MQTSEDSFRFSVVPHGVGYFFVVKGIIEKIEGLPLLIHVNFNAV